MKTIELKLNSPSGLHGRPSTLLANVASKYTSEVTLEYKGKTANAKDVLSVMALSIMHEGVFSVCAEGTDAEAAIQDIHRVLESEGVL